MHSEHLLRTVEKVNGCLRTELVLLLGLDFKLSSTLLFNISQFLYIYIQYFVRLPLSSDCYPFLSHAGTNFGFLCWLTF